MLRHRRKKPHAITHVATLVLLVAALAAQRVVATTFMSVEPIPGGQVVGEPTLALIESAGYENLELWSNRLLNQCGIVQRTINALSARGAISTVNGGNTTVLVAAGGFEGITHPSFVFTIRDSGPGSVSAADVDVLDNALGYVLNQEGTAQFSPDNFKAYAFPLDYAVVTFEELTGVGAQAFFEYLGTIDAALFSGQFAGFTQIAFQGSPVPNSMLFLKPAASKNRFIAGLSAASSTTPGTSYFPLKNNGQPTTVRAGISFPGNDWIAFPGGDEYLSQLGNPSSGLLADLAALQQAHRDAVSDLVHAIQTGNLSQYLGPQFACPTVK